VDCGIQFGDLEEAAARNARRPDRNRHYAVAACGSPAADELPIYIDMDVMMEIQNHALSDTSVELGGVMLGGQSKDDQGQPFVLIADSLRAQHYESTKGSFKFTHDTWTRISRERDGFPDDFQMVGWYHTHPGWGVFLSGRDTFISDNFFNRPLDLALVVDPCRGESGFFQWTGDPKERLRRTGGFFVVSSRFRRRELEHYVAYLEGEFDMKTDSSHSGYPGLAGPYPAPVVNVSEQRPGWMGAAVLGTLVIQLCLMLLIAWRLIVPTTAPSPEAEPPKEIAALQERLDELGRTEQTAAQLAAQREILDHVIGRVEVAPEGLVASLQQERERNEELRAALVGFGALEEENRSLHSKLTDVKKSRTALSDQIDRLRTEMDQLRKSQSREIAKLTAELKELKGQETAATKEATDQKDDEPTDGKGPSTSRTAVMVGVIVAAVAAVLGIGVIMFLKRRRKDDESPEEEADATEGK